MSWLTNLDTTVIKKTNVKDADVSQQLAFLEQLKQSRPDISPAQIEQAKLDTLRGQQSDFLNQLKAQADGTAPSLAQQQLQSAQEANLRQAQAQAASTRGAGPAALNLQNQQRLTAEGGQQVAQKVAELRLQEQAAARQQLGSQLNNQQAFEGTLATQQAQLNQNAALANQDAETKRLTLGGQTAAGIDSARNASNNLQAQLDSDREKAKRQAKADTIGGVAGLVGSAASLFSDKRVKEDIQPIKPDEMAAKTQEFLDALKAYDWRYKGTNKPHVGVMTQDLEKTDLGKSMVTEDVSTGLKKVDVAQGLGGVLASLAAVNERLSALEKSKKGGK